jgi:hypothetical protein
VFAKDDRGNTWTRRRIDDAWTAWINIAGALSRAIDVEYPGVASAFDESDVRLFARDEDGRLLLVAGTP